MRSLSFAAVLLFHSPVIGHTRLLAYAICSLLIVDALVKESLQNPLAPIWFTKCFKSQNKFSVMSSGTLHLLLLLLVLLLLLIIIITLY